MYRHTYNRFNLESTIDKEYKYLFLNLRKRNTIFLNKTSDRWSDDLRQPNAYGMSKIFLSEIHVRRSVREVP